MAWLRLFFWMLAITALVVIAIDLAFQVSPWPSALLLRRNMNRGGLAQQNALETHAPAGVSVQRDLRYETTDSGEYLDVFYPSNLTDELLPTIVWVHGGGWLAGDKQQIASYLAVLASAGYTTIGVNYALAPGSTYPVPIQQVNASLAYIQTHAKQLHADSKTIFLAGDSAGAQIAAQLAAIITSPTYANTVEIIPSIDRSQLAGLILYCGLYDGLSLEFRQTIRGLLRSPGSLFWWPLRTQLWSYFGTADFVKDPRFEQFSVARHITPNFPPMFISVGSADWLAPQSYRFAGLVGSLGVFVDSLFFPENNVPELYHEFQFDLDSDAAKLALKRSIAFLRQRLQLPVQH